MGLLYTSRIIPTSAAATSAASGYPAANALLQSIGVPWRAANTTQQDVTIDLGSALTPRGIGVQDTNATSIVIASSPDNITYTDRATLDLTNVDRFSRRRGCAGVSTLARYWRLRIASGTPPDGLAYWRIGAVYVFGAMASIVNPKQRGLKRVTDHAENRERVANGRTAVAAIGSRFDVVSGQFGIRSSGALLLDPLLEELRRGGGWFDLQNTYQKSWTWPLIADSAQDEESNDQGGPDYTVIALNAREMVA